MGNPIAATAGMLVGSTVGVLVVSALVGQLFKEYEPSQRAVRGVFAGTIICSMVSVFGFGGPRAIPYYAVGGLISFFIYRKMLLGSWSEDQ